MQGATELVLLGIAFLGLQAWWLSRVFWLVQGSPDRLASQ
jgi:hypothetical protein